MYNACVRDDTASSRFPDLLTSCMAMKSHIRFELDSDFRFAAAAR
jgi:hypothetical protein